MKKTSVSRKIFVVFNYTFLSVVGLCCLLPFVHMLAVSFSSTAAVAAGRVAFLPVDFTTAAYEFAFRGGKFAHAMLNSVKVVVVGTLVNVVMMLLTAYPMSKENNELLGRNIYAAYFIITMLVSGGMIPTYLVVSQLHLKDTIWALVLPGALPVYNMVILMNFIRGLPKELMEAARIDGAKEIRILYTILLPLLKPALATVALFCMVGHWNNWFGPIIYMNRQENYTLAAYLRKMSIDFDALLRNAGGNYEILVRQLNAQTGRAAQLFLGCVPIILVYPFLQKYFTTGLTIGSVKG